METGGGSLGGVSLKRKVKKQKIRGHSTLVRTKIGSAAGKSPGKLSLGMGDTVQEGERKREVGEIGSNGDRAEAGKEVLSGEGKNIWVKMSAGEEGGDGWPEGGKGEEVFGHKGRGRERDRAGWEVGRGEREVKGEAFIGGTIWDV